MFARHQQSFDRLEPGHEAPGVVCWGSSNRTALIRIPDASDPQDTRIEYRGGDASGSTYILCAVLLAAGLDGLERNLPCPPEVTVNADHLTDAELAALGIKRLPRTRDAAVKILETSAWLKKVLGEPIINYFLQGGKKKH